MKLGLVLGVAAITAFSFAAQAQTKSAPPAPRPAAGALSTPTQPQSVGGVRTQTAEEQRLSQQAAPIEPGPVGQSR